jgi:hypothetical protein
VGGRGGSVSFPKYEPAPSSLHTSNDLSEVNYVLDWSPLFFIKSYAAMHTVLNRTSQYIQSTEN